VVTSVIALAGCGDPTAGASAEAQAVAAAAPAGAAAVPAATAPARCRDGLSPVASLAPGGIGIDSGTWPSGSTMAAIRKDGRLIVGTSGDAELWGASDPRSGKLTGYDVDLAAEVAKALGVRIEYKVLPLSGRLPALKSGTVDLVAERMTMNCDRWQGSTADGKTYINFSSQYYTAGQRVLVRTDSKARRIEDLKGQPVCAVAGSTSLANLEGVDVEKVVAKDSGQCLVKFQEGEAVAISADDTTLAGFAKQDPYARVVGAAFTSEPYGLGMKAGADDFTRFVNAVLEGLRADGTLQKLYDTWMKPNVDTAAPGVPKAVYGRNVAALKRQS
jgi:polar amino acid transport system substrate-binding protein